MTSLESLLSTSASELTHRLSERVALLCGKIPEKKYGDAQEVYALTKEAYSLRSKIIHGGTLSDLDREKLPVVVERVDGILRFIARNALDIDSEEVEFFSLFEKTTEALDQYFLEWILSDSK
jgi:hypothetical protein